MMQMVENLAFYNKNKVKPWSHIQCFPLTLSTGNSRSNAPTGYGPSYEGNLLEIYGT